ncbi:MAG TPA: glycosyltransferase family 39 protein, partial [Anaerolineae bacterium]|nr:glycosyltransferase family 39 protein [Anaerolineae bacterium]
RTGRVMLLDLLLLLVMLLAPGLAVRASFASVTRDESFGEAAFGVVFISALVSGWIALVLAELALFSLWAVTGLTLAVSLAMLVVRRRRLRSPLAAVRPGGWDAAALALLIVAAWLFFRPNEYVLGGRDHGVYVNTGARIARTGSILSADPALADVPPDRRGALVEYRPLVRGGDSIVRAWHAGTSVPGFYLFHLDAPVVQPHGFHLYPVWFAVLGAAGGVEFSLFLTPALAWLSLASVVLTARRTFGRGAALLAGALLAVNLAQLWSARTPSAEIMAQFLFWSGLWAWVRAIQTEEAGFGVLGGLAWGQLHLAKIDYVMLPVVLLAWAAWAQCTGRYRRYHTLGLVAYALMIGHAIVHAALVAPSYTFDVVSELAPAAIGQRLSAFAAEAVSPLDLAARLVAQSMPAIVAAVVALALIGLVLRRVKDRGAAAWARLTSNRWSAPVLAAAIVGLSVYAYFIRPGVDTGLGADVYVELSWYLGPLALALGTVGLARRVGQSEPALSLVLWSVVGLGVVFLAGGSFTYPDHFWAVRRFVPVIVPGFLLLASDAVMSIVPHSLQDWRRALIPLVLAGGMLVAAFEASTPFIRFIENRGVTDQLRALDQQFEPNAVLLFDREAPGAQIGTPLAMIFGRMVAFVGGSTMRNDPSPAVNVWQRSGRAVYYLSSAADPIVISGYSLDYLRTEVAAWPAAEQTVVFRPTRSGEASAAFDVYRVLSQQAVEDRVVTLDVGPEESEPATRGMHVEPLVPGLTTAQWTTGSASFTLKVDGRPRRLLLRMGDTPSQIAPFEVDVTANGASLGRITLRPEQMSVYTLRFPADAAPTDTVVVELRLTTWSPRALGLNADRRDLGVRVDWVKILVKRP